MSAVSTQDTLKANLLAQLQARAGLAGVQVAYGFPKTPATEFLMLGDIAKGDEQTAALGNRSRDEKYTLFVTVKVEKQGTNQQAATERAYTLAGELAGQLRTDPSVNGAVITALVQGTELQEFASNQGQAARMAVVTVHVGCHARLRT